MDFAFAVSMFDAPTSSAFARPPPLRNLRAFCAAGRHLSFKGAADALYLTPSAISHQMKELEDALGVRLFDRKIRSLELTTAGHELLQDAEPHVNALDSIMARIARRSGRQSLRVQLPPFFASELFIPRLMDFCSAHPQIDIQLDTSDPRPATHPPAADLSILLLQAESEPQGVTSQRLFSLSLTAACAKDHARDVARLGGEVFRDLALIVHRARPHAWSSWAEEVGLAAPEPKNVIKLDTMSAVVRAAELGVGVALVPTLLCDSWFQSGALVRIFPVELQTNEAYFLVSRPRDAHRPAVQALTSWVLKQFSQLV